MAFATQRGCLIKSKATAPNPESIEKLRRIFMKQNKTLYVPAETEILKFDSETDVIRTSTVETEVNGWQNPWITWTDYEEGGKQ